MLEYLTQIDTELFIWLNGFHNDFFDQVMWNISSKLSWILILVAFLVIVFRKGWQQATLAVLAVAVCVLISDQISSGLIKHAVERLRPSHNMDLASTIHLVNGYKGGQFGFTSSHAANSFGVALLLGLMLRNRGALWAMMGWALLQCYSRIYLGVHYPGDLLGGMVVGLLAGWVAYWLWKTLQRRWLHTDARVYDRSDALIINLAIGITIVGIVITAFLYDIILDSIVWHG